MNLSGLFSVPAIALLPLVLPIAAACEITLVIADDPCVRVTAHNVSRSGGGVQVGGATARRRKNQATDCPPIHGLHVVTFRDMNGDAEYTSPPDHEVDQYHATSPQAGDSISVGSFSNLSAQNGTATHWEVTVNSTGGDHSFSGTF